MNNQSVPRFRDHIPLCFHTVLISFDLSVSRFSSPCLPSFVSLLFSMSSMLSFLFSSLCLPCSRFSSLLYVFHALVSLLFSSLHLHIAEVCLCLFYPTPAETPWKLGSKRPNT